MAVVQHYDLELTIALDEDLDESRRQLARGHVMRLDEELKCRAGYIGECVREVRLELSRVVHGDAEMLRAGRLGEEAEEIFIGERDGTISKPTRPWHGLSTSLS